MKPTYNFPYYGAGEATYFEWAFVSVIFKEEPTEEQKKLIEKNVPFPIEEIDWEENLMTAESGQFTHSDIAKTYQTKDGLDPEDKENWEDDLWFFAADSQVNAFNTDIERWFNEIHKISPIVLALRGEDSESGGTELSDWHTWSLKQYKSILPYFDAIVTDFDYDSTKARVLSWILYFTKTEDISKLHGKYIKYLHPGELEFEAFEKGNIEPLKSITNSNHLERAIRTFNHRLSEDHQKEIEKYAEVFLGFESKIFGKTFRSLLTVLFTHFTDINSETFKKIAKNITNIHFVDRIAGNAYQLMTNGKYKESIQIFEKLLLVSVKASIRSGFYTNMLWVFQKDNTGLPINKKRNLLALEKCFPKGAEFPAIFFNACCIYTEMEEYNKAYEMVQEALAHNYNKESMLSEIKTEGMFKEFRKKTTVLELLETHKLEPKENPKPRFIGESIAYGQFDVHTIYNKGYAVKFSNILLINGNVTISGEFNDVYKTLIDDNIILTEEKKEKTLVIVNGNLSAKSISKYESVSLLVMGKITCKEISHEGVIEKGNTNFDYIVHKPKKHNE